MCNLSNFLSFHQIVYIRDRVLNLIDFRRYWVNFDDIVFDFVKSPARNYDKMSFLCVFTLNSEYNFVFLVVYLKLLKFLRPAAAVYYTFLYDFTDILILVVDPHLRSICWTQTNIKIPYCYIRIVIVIIFACNSPRPMRSRYQ